MDVSVAVTFGCAVLAAASTGVLVGRSIRAPRMDIIAWAFAVAAIAASLGAQAFGAHNGYASATFRVVQVGAQLIAPLWLAWGMVELAGQSISARFGAKLVTAALTVVGAVVLITDPLAATPFTKSWPLSSAHYQIIARSVLNLVAGVTVATVVVTLALALVRLRRDPAWRQPLIALAAAGVAAVALLALRLRLPVSLAYPALCAVCAALACLAGLAAAKVRLDELHGLDKLYDEALDDEALDDEWAPAEPALPQALADETAVFGASYPHQADNGAPPRFMDDDWYRLDRGKSGRSQSERSVADRSQSERSMADRSQSERSMADRSQSERSVADRSQSNGGYPAGAGHWRDGESGVNAAANGTGNRRPGTGFRPEAPPVSPPPSGLAPAGPAWGAPAPAAPARGAPARDAPARDAPAPAAPAAAPAATAPASPAPASPAPASLAPSRLSPPRLSPPSTGPASGRPASTVPTSTGPASTVPARPAPARPDPGSIGGVAAERNAARRLFGLIAIYTLAEGRSAEFDALAERLVGDVRASEPDALVYAVHSVPNAPLQRIFYEVYRDHAAYEEHQRQPYVERFAAERDSCVLATNVIELGTQEAKLSPLPGLTQIFGHSSGG